VWGGGGRGTGVWAGACSGAAACRRCSAPRAAPVFQRHAPAHLLHGLQHLLEVAQRQLHKGPLLAAQRVRQRL
jgi:hypothetical protein